MYNSNQQRKASLTLPCSQRSAGTCTSSKQKRQLSPPLSRSLGSPHVPFQLLWKEGSTTMQRGSRTKQTRPFSLSIYLLIVCGLSWPFQFVSIIWARDLLSVYVLNTASMVMVTVGMWLCGRSVFRDGFAGAGWRWGRPWHYVTVIGFALFLWIVPTLIDLALGGVRLPTRGRSG